MPALDAGAPGLQGGLRAGREAGVRGGPSGDLYIFLSIQPHDFFQREGTDIFCRAPISIRYPLVEAATATLCVVLFYYEVIERGAACEVKPSWEIAKAILRQL